MMNFTNNPYLNGGMFPAQQRVMQMDAQYPMQFGQPQPQQVIATPTQPIINATFVTNLQEAQAQPVGINATNVAIDNTNNKIYLKRMDNNGISATKTYIPLEEVSSSVEESLPSVDVNVFKDDLTSLKSEVSDLRNSFDKNFINLSVELENIITSTIGSEMKKLKGERNAK